MATKLAKTVTPLATAATMQTLMTVAEKQGQIMGTHCKNLQSEAATWQRESHMNEVALGCTESQLLDKTEQLASVNQDLRAASTTLLKTQDQLERANQKMSVMKTKWNPKNVKRRLETKDKQLKKAKDAK
jgi:hypothetical protein